MRTLEKNQFCLLEIDREKQKRDGLQEPFVFCSMKDRFGFYDIHEPFYQCELEKD